MTLTGIEYPCDELLLGEFSVSVVIHTAEDVQDTRLTVTQPFLELKWNGILVTQIHILLSRNYVAE